MLSLDRSHVPLCLGRSGIAATVSNSLYGGTITVRLRQAKTGCVGLGVLLPCFLRGMQRSQSGNNSWSKLLYMYSTVVTSSGQMININQWKFRLD